MESVNRFRTVLEKSKIPLIVLAAGIILMTMPINSTKKEKSSGEDSFRDILCSVHGVGRAEVLISDSGVVVVCEGADKAEIRLKILRCVKSYTGFASDKVSILKMKE